MSSTDFLSGMLSVKEGSKIIKHYQINKNATKN